MFKQIFNYITNKLKSELSQQMENIYLKYISIKLNDRIIY